MKASGKIGSKGVYVSDNAEKCFETYTYIKCKAIPLQSWTGPEGSRKLRLPDFKKIGA